MAMPNFSMLFPIGDGEDEEPDVHKLIPEAQADNLRAAWEAYQRPKAFAPGDLVRGITGLGVFRNDPIMLYVRNLDAGNAFDLEVMRKDVQHCRWNKLDCVTMLCDDDGGIAFYVMDRDLLEPYVPEEKL